MEARQSQPLEAIYPIIYLDAIHLRLRQKGKVVNTDVYIVLDAKLDGRCDVLGCWVGDGGEAANCWQNVVIDLQNRNV